MNDIFVKVATCAAYVLAIIICRYLVPWIKTKIGETNFSKLYDFTVLAVRTYNQTMTPEENQKKKDKAIEYVRAKAIQLGLDLTYEDIDNLIEGVVNEVKEAAKVG